MIGYTFSAAWWREQSERQNAMINYQDQKTRDTANQIAANHTGQLVGGMEPQRNGASKETSEQVRVRAGDKTQG